MNKIDIHYLVTIVVVTDKPKDYQWMLKLVAECLMRYSILENIGISPPKGTCQIKKGNDNFILEKKG